MQIVPVIDILNHEIVHAIAGSRQDYSPFTDSQFDFEGPLDLARQWVSLFEPNSFYMADLDAIFGRGENSKLLADLMTLPTRFLVDGGFCNYEDFDTYRRRVNQRRAERLSSNSHAKGQWSPVFGSESVVDPSQLAMQLGDLLKEVFFSIDVKEKQILGACFAKNTTVEQALSQLISIGFRNLIILDLDAVGTGTQKLQNSNYIQPFSGTAQIYVGGGIKNQSDLAKTEKLGVTGVLLSTAIHNGSIVST